MASFLNCSGESHAGVPATKPVLVSDVDSLENAIPKSISFGPSLDIKIFEGFISR